MHTFLYVKNIRKISFVYLEQSTIKHKSCVCYVYYYFFCSYLFFRPKKVWKKIYTQHSLLSYNLITFDSLRREKYTVALSFVYITYIPSICENIFWLNQPISKNQKRKRTKIQKKILVENKTKNPSICLSSAIRMYDCSNKNNTRLTIVYSRSRRDSTSSI